jgi:hypothetical protein
MKVVILQLDGTRISGIALNYENKTGYTLVMIFIIVSMLKLLALLLQICTFVKLSTSNSLPVTWFTNLRPSYRISGE